MATRMRDGALLEAKKTKLKPPPLFKVILLNDDYTPMEFVVIVLQRFFSMTREKATQVMLKVHREGMGICGVYPRDVATTKVEQVVGYARKHQLLALLDNPTAAEVLRACAANIEELRKALGDFIAAHTPTVAGTEEIDTQPTLGFQRVIQRAILHVQSSGKKEVTGANVLVAIFGEKDSHAVYFLHQQGVTRLDVVNYISPK